MTSYELTRCVICGGADAREVAAPDDIRVEAELLWQFHRRRLSPRTPPERLLTQLLDDTGFRVERTIADVLVPTADEWTKAWAVLEERTIKPLTKRWWPWFEVYARRAN